MQMSVANKYTYEHVCELTRESLFPSETKIVGLLEDCDWNTLYLQMKEQAIGALPQRWLQDNALPDDALRTEWLKYCVKNQARWLRIMVKQDQMLKLLEKHALDCVIIKGSAAAIAYPSPSLRAVGDVDILVKRSDFERTKTILEENGYELVQEHVHSHHHYCYKKDGVYFELHKRLGIVQEKDEKLLNLFESGIGQRQYTHIDEFTFPMLPTDLNGLVLMFHINQHLRSGLGLRHIIDWMMYLNQNDNFDRLLPIFRETGMEKLAITVTLLCQEYLGLGELTMKGEKALQVSTDDALKGDVLSWADYPVEELMAYIFEKGDFGRKSGEEGKIASIFLLTKNPVQLIKRLQKGGMYRWKSAKKYKALRPFAWIYQIVRIMRELSNNQISPVKLAEQHKTGIEQRDLIYKLGLETDSRIKC